MKNTEEQKLNQYEKKAVEMFKNCKNINEFNTKYDEFRVGTNPNETHLYAKRTNLGIKIDGYVGNGFNTISDDDYNDRFVNFIVDEETEESDETN